MRRGKLTQKMYISPPPRPPNPGVRLPCVDFLAEASKTARGLSDRRRPCSRLSLLAPLAAKKQRQHIVSMPTSPLPTCYVAPAGLPCHQTAETTRAAHGQSTAPVSDPTAPIHSFSRFSACGTTPAKPILHAQEIKLLVRQSNTPTHFPLASHQI